MSKSEKKSLCRIPKHGQPVNGVSGRHYSGANVDELLGAMDDGGFEDPRWVTFKQALSIGRCVRKGEKAAAQITKWVEDKKAPKKGKGKAKLFPKAYCVFNIEQTEVLEAK